MKSIKQIHIIFALVIHFTAAAWAQPITYEGTVKGIGAGKHIVFIASDHEYRGEESCPALARILAKYHGFKCTVVFGVDADGYIKAGSSNIPGTEVLKDADLMVIFARFLNPPAKQMQPIVDYINRGGPVVGMRTSSHAFKIPADSEFAKYDFRAKTKGYENGFGHQVLGNTWVGHYGRNHRQGSRIQIVPENKSHIILTGVKDNAFCYAGGYMGHAHEGFTVLTRTQPLVALKPDAAPDKTKKPVPSTWTRHYTGKNGTKGRVFHTTQGASEDLLDASYRRMLVNGILWAVGLEKTIKTDLKIDFVGPYHPLPFTFNGEAQKVKPSDLAGFKSPITPRGKKHAPKRTVKRNQ
jgi:type 1 glutamine amidotransferase